MSLEELPGTHRYLIYRCRGTVFGAAAASLLLEAMQKVEVTWWLTRLNHGLHASAGAGCQAVL